jgi:ribosomal subunit interface protein
MVMRADLEIAFHGLDPSPAVETAVRHHAEELEKFSDRLISCRVVLEAVDQRHRKGNLYGVRIDLMVPEGPVVVTREPGQHHTHEDIYVAIHDAFDKARRELQDHMRRLDAKVKQHETPLIGRIVRLFPDRGYGFLAAETGEEVYVHRNSVRDGGFGVLKVGDRVRYVVDPEEGEQGAQASMVIPLDAGR